MIGKFSLWLKICQSINKDVCKKKEHLWGIYKLFPSRLWIKKQAEQKFYEDQKQPQLYPNSAAVQQTIISDPNCTAHYTLECGCSCRTNAEITPRVPIYDSSHWNRWQKYATSPLPPLRLWLYYLRGEKSPINTGPQKTD